MERHTKHIAPVSSQLDNVFISSMMSSALKGCVVSVLLDESIRVSIM